MKLPSSIFPFCLCFCLAISCSLAENDPSQGSNYSIKILRKQKRLLVINKDGKTVLEAAVGIGRGGLGKKNSMSDCITPAGNFKVDLILYQDSAYNDIAPSSKRKYASNKEISKILASREGLAGLFSNMNSLDFDGDGRSDTAYGAAYIGLDSKDSVTGPKISQFSGKTYWYSIALHGTPHEKENIGKSHSGGCVQLPETCLKRLIEEGILKTGSELLIE